MVINCLEGGEIGTSTKALNLITHGYFGSMQRVKNCFIKHMGTLFLGTVASFNLHVLHRKIENENGYFRNFASEQSILIGQSHPVSFFCLVTGSCLGCMFRRFPAELVC